MTAPDTQPAFVPTEPGWDGLPPGGEGGWHLLLSISPPAYEEVWHFDPSRDLPWERREKGVRHGWEPKHMSRKWAYVGRLALVCKAAGVPAFFKQTGIAWQPDHGWGHRITGSKGDDPAQWPAEFRVQEFPL